ncbi:MAG: S8 family peptidase [bacterium]|nr:S8 family peptidase [bacterium]
MSQDVFYTPPSTIKISPDFSNWLSNASPQAQIKIWVFFTDKEIFTDSEYKKAVKSAEMLLPQRIKNKRLKVKKSGALCDFTDLPVSSEYIKKLKKTNCKVEAVSKWLNAVSIKISINNISQLEQEIWVQKITPVRVFCCKQEATFVDTIDYGSSQRQLEQINVAAAHSMGYTGKDVIIGILDTGFEWRKNKILQGINVIAERDFIGNDDTTSYQEGQIDSVWDGITTIIHREEDSYGLNQIAHGTAMLSLLGGRAANRCIGAAFGASFALAKTELVWTTQTGFDCIAEEDWWIEGVEWLTDSIGVDIISNSLGYKQWINPGQSPAYAFDSLDGKHYPMDICAGLLWSKNVLLVTAMGNYHFADATADTSIVSPASADSIIAVGGVDTLGNWVERDSIANTGSSVGPRTDGAIKPEVCGPWLGSYSMPAPSSYPNYDSIVDYIGHGASDATALVAGACALVKQAHPEWSAMELRSAILKTATLADSPNDTLGYGIVNAKFAITGIKEDKKDTCQILFFIIRTPSSIPSIMYQLPVKTNISLKMYDLSGRLTSILVDKEQNRGCYNIEIGAKNLPTGIYFVKLKTDNYITVKKLIIMK